MYLFFPSALLSVPCIVLYFATRMEPNCYQTKKIKTKRKNHNQHISVKLLSKLSWSGLQESLLQKQRSCHNYFSMLPLQESSPLVSSPLVRNRGATKCNWQLSLLNITWTHFLSYYLKKNVFQNTEKHWHFSSSLFTSLKTNKQNTITMHWHLTISITFKKNRPWISFSNRTGFQETTSVLTNKLRNEY